jgi:hypothetical protein
MAEAEYVLTQLRQAVQALRALPRPLNDASPGIQAFWRVLERCLRDGGRAFKVRLKIERNERGRFSSLLFSSLFSSLLHCLFAVVVD